MQWFDTPGDPEKLQQPIDDEKPAEGMEIADQVTSDALKEIIADAVAHVGGAVEEWRFRRNQMIHKTNIWLKNLDHDLESMEQQKGSRWYVW